MVSIDAEKGCGGGGRDEEDIGDDDEVNDMPAEDNDDQLVYVQYVDG